MLLRRRFVDFDPPALLPADRGAIYLAPIAIANFANPRIAEPIEHPQEARFIVGAADAAGYTYAAPIVTDVPETGTPTVLGGAIPSGRAIIFPLVTELLETGEPRTLVGTVPSANALPFPLITDIPETGEPRNIAGAIPSSIALLPPLWPNVLEPGEIKSFAGAVSAGHALSAPIVTEVAETGTPKTFIGAVVSGAALAAPIATDIGDTGELRLYAGTVPSGYVLAHAPIADALEAGAPQFIAGTIPSGYALRAPLSTEVAGPGESKLVYGALTVIPNVIQTFNSRITESVQRGTIIVPVLPGVMLPFNTGGGRDDHYFGYFDLPDVDARCLNNIAWELGADTYSRHVRFNEFAMRALGITMAGEGDKEIKRALTIIERKQNINAKVAAVGGAAYVTWTIVKWALL